MNILTPHPVNLDKCIEEMEKNNIPKDTIIERIVNTCHKTHIPYHTTKDYVFPEYMSELTFKNLNKYTNIDPLWYKVLLYHTKSMDEIFILDNPLLYCRCRKYWNGKTYYGDIDERSMFLENNEEECIFNNDAVNIFCVWYEIKDVERLFIKAIEYDCEKIFKSLCSKALIKRVNITNIFNKSYKYRGIVNDFLRTNILF